jgi:tRNA dimethylallyltransferase
MGLKKPKLVVIAGPTASGKTGTGIATARAVNGEIVSADSIQIYRGMDVGSAKPTPDERLLAVHHMIDVCDPDADFSAGDYVKAAREVIADIVRRNAVPIVVGGTGLYIKALLGGLADLPPVDPAIRETLRERASVEGADALHSELTRLDPEAAGWVKAHNTTRVIRYLEIFLSAGRKVSEILREHAFADRPYHTLFLTLDPGRATLYERIDRRVESMVKGGLLEETARLIERGYARSLKSMQSIGYRHAGMVLAGEAPLEDAVSLMKRDTRRFAKRQYTWFRSEPECTWIAPDDTQRIGTCVEDFLG